MKTSVRALSLAAAGCTLAAIAGGASAHPATRGAAALDGKTPKLYTVVTDGPLTAPTSNQTDASVSCPAGTVVWGGGASVPGSSVAVNIAASFPTDNGWYVEVNNISGASASFSVSAVCAQRPRKYTIWESAEYDTPPQSQSSGAQACPGNATVLGGGVASTAGSFVTDINSTMPAGNGWAAYMSSTATRPTSFNVYAICGKAPLGYGVVTGPAASTPPFSRSETSVSCPGKARPLSGGVLSGSRSPSVTLNSSMPTAHGWSVWQDNAGGVSAPFTAYAICA
jgi:hypothetical protein